MIISPTTSYSTLRIQYSTTVYSIRYNTVEYNVEYLLLYANTNHFSFLPFTMSGLLYDILTLLPPTPRCIQYGSCPRETQITVTCVKRAFILCVTVGFNVPLLFEIAESF